MPSFFDLQKYAATGIASPDMTAFDKARALSLFGGGKTRTLTDVPPLSFKANGKPLISWSMSGNGSQSGTPTPDAPIQPQFVGVRTENLWDEDYTGISGNLKYVPVFVGEGTFTLSTDTPNYSGNAPLFLLSGNVASGASTTVNGVYNGVSRTTDSSNGYITIAFIRQSESTNPMTHKTMLNLGSTALPYEPYGWVEKITCAGQTVPVYLGQTQTVRRIKKLVLDGTENWTKNSPNMYIQPSDILKGSELVCSHYKDYSDYTVDLSVTTYRGTRTSIWFNDSEFTTTTQWKQFLADQYAAGTPVTVWYVLAEPTTGIVNEPLCKIGNYADELSSEDAAVTIPTVKGDNTLTVEGDLPPSSMTITYKG